MFRCYKENSTFDATTSYDYQRDWPLLVLFLRYIDTEESNPSNFFSEFTVESSFQPVNSLWCRNRDGVFEVCSPASTPWHIRKSRRMYDGILQP